MDAAPSAQRASPSARRRSRRPTSLLAPELAADVARVKRAKSIGVRSGRRLTLRMAQALLNAPDIRPPSATHPRHHRHAARLCLTPARGGGPHGWALVG